MFSNMYGSSLNSPWASLNWGLGSGSHGKQMCFLAFASTISNVNNVLVPSLSDSSNSWTRVEGGELYIQYEEHTCHYMFGCPRWQPLQNLNLVNPLHSSWKGSITQHTCPVHLVFWISLAPWLTHATSIEMESIKTSLNCKPLSFPTNCESTIVWKEGNNRVLNASPTMW